MKEVDWSDTEVLIVDMPPGTGEEVRGLLQLHPDAAVVVTGPQRISESAVRKAVVMGQEYRIPLLGHLQNTAHAGEGEAGRRLAELYRLPLLAEVPWSQHIQRSMEGQVPFDYQPFLPVAQASAATILAPPASVEPLPNREAELLREAEEWVTDQGMPAAAPAARPNADGLGVFVGGPPEAESAPDIPPDVPPDIPPDISSAFREITDDEWADLRPLIPDAFQEDRGLFNGILWVFTTENPWKDMPQQRFKRSGWIVGGPGGNHTVVDERPLGKHPLQAFLAEERHFLHVMVHIGAERRSNPAQRLHTPEQVRVDQSAMLDAVPGVRSRVSSLGLLVGGKHHVYGQIAVGVDAHLE